MSLSTTGSSIPRKMTIAGHEIVWRSPANILGRFNFQAGDELCGLFYQNQLWEGLHIEFEGTWFEIFMYDHVRDLYALERIA